MSDSSFLAGRHARFRVPTAVVVELVKRATGFEVVETHRVVAGYDNEVYRVRVADGGTVYPRIRRFGEEQGGARGEAWAMAQARSAGVPAPEVLLLDTIAGDDGECEVMVVAEAPGRELPGVLRTLSARQRHIVMMRLGEILARLHSVGTPGPWRPDDDGVWPEPEQVRRWFIADRAAEHADLVAAGLDGYEVDRIIEILDQGWEPVAHGAAILCHGDISPDHVFIDDDLQISGLIDWGMWAGGSTTADLANASLRNTDDDFAAIVQGHGTGSFDERSFRRGIALATLAEMAGTMAHHQRIGDTNGMPSAVNRLRRVLTEFTDPSRGQFQDSMSREREPE